MKRLVIPGAKSTVNEGVGDALVKKNVVRLRNKRFLVRVSRSRWDRSGWQVLATEEVAS